MIQKLNQDLTAQIQTKHGLTREIKITDSIRQGGVLSVLEYATMMDEISKELKEKDLGLMTKSGEKIDSLLWMDDVLTIHYDLEIMQEILDTVNHVAKKYHVVFGIKKCEVIRDGKGPPSNLKLEKELETILNETLKYKYLGEMLNNKGNMEDHIKYIKGKIQGATQKIISTT